MCDIYYVHECRPNVFVVSCVVEKRILQLVLMFPYVFLLRQIDAILKNIQEPDAQSNDWEAQLLAWCRRSTQG